MEEDRTDKLKMQKIRHSAGQRSGREGVADYRTEDKTYERKETRQDRKEDWTEDRS